MTRAACNYIAVAARSLPPSLPPFGRLVRALDKIDSARALLTAIDLTVLVPQSRFGDKILRVCMGLSPKGDCGSKRVNILLRVLRGTIVNGTYGAHKNLPGIYSTFFFTNDIWSYLIP